MASKKLLNEHVAGPPWLTDDKMKGKHSGILAKFDYSLIPPKNLPKELYSTYNLDDLDRPFIFDCYLLTLIGHLPWAYEDSLRLELHIEKGLVRFYSHKHITQYRVNYALATGIGLPSHMKNVKNTKNHLKHKIASSALVRSIYDDVQIYSPMNQKPLPGHHGSSIKASDLPMIPSSLDFSIRDVSEIWLETSSHHIISLLFATGLSISMAVDDAEALTHHLTKHLQLAHIYPVSVSHTIRKRLIQKCISIAKDSKDIRFRIKSGDHIITSEEKKKLLKKNPEKTNDLLGKMKPVEFRNDEPHITDILIDPYDESFILMKNDKNEKSTEITENNQKEVKSTSVDVYNSKYLEELKQTAERLSLSERFQVNINFDLSDDDDLEAYDASFLASSRTNPLFHDNDDNDDNSELEDYVYA